MIVLLIKGTRIDRHDQPFPQLPKPLKCEQCIASLQVNIQVVQSYSESLYIVQIYI